MPPTIPLGGDDRNSPGRHRAATVAGDEGLVQAQTRIVRRKAMLPAGI